MLKVNNLIGFGSGERDNSDWLNWDGTSDGEIVQITSAGYISGTGPVGDSSCELGGDKVLCISDNGNCGVRVIICNNLSISLGGTAYTTNTASRCGVVPLDTDKAIFYYRDISTVMYAAVVTVSGTAPTINSFTAISSTTDVAYGMRLCKINKTKFFITYPASSENQCRILTVTGTTITTGSTYQLPNFVNSGELGQMSILENKALVFNNVSVNRMCILDLNTVSNTVTLEHEVTTTSRCWDESIHAGSLAWLSATRFITIETWSRYNGGSPYYGIVSSVSLWSYEAETATRLNCSSYFNGSYNDNNSGGINVSHHVEVISPTIAIISGSLGHTYEQNDLCHSYAYDFSSDTCSNIASVIVDTTNSTYTGGGGASRLDFNRVLISWYDTDGKLSAKVLNGEKQ